MYLELVCSYFKGKLQMCTVLFHSCLSVIEFSVHILFLVLKFIFLEDYITRLLTLMGECTPIKSNSRMMAMMVVTK